MIFICLSDTVVQSVTQNVLLFTANNTLEHCRESILIAIHDQLQSKPYCQEWMIYPTGQIAAYYGVLLYLLLGKPVGVVVVDAFSIKMSSYQYSDCEYKANAISLY